MKGRIYKLFDNTNGNVYYGSSIQEINKRISSHKADYKRYLEGLSYYTTSFGIIKNNDYKYELVEENNFDTKYDLHERERYYIENFDCINKVIPNRTDEEHKEQMLEYRENNKEKIATRMKEYNEKNKEKKRDYVKNIKKKRKKKLLAIVVLL